MTDSYRPDPSTITPERFSNLLREFGWRTVGYQPGSYYRLQREADTESIVIPADPDAADYPEVMGAAIAAVERSHSGLWVRSIAPRLTDLGSDTFRFRRESSSPSGLIPWDQGQALILAARGTLLAGAKTYREPSRHYSNRFGQFANRYLETILMGQTEPGSYVVTAYAPPRAAVAVHRNIIDSLAYEGIDVAPAGQVTDSVVHALDATTGALEHYKATSSLDGFEAAVDEGASYEMASALRDLTRDAEGADILVERETETSVGLRTYSYEFTGGDSDVFGRAAVELTKPIETVRHRAVGRVHLLTRKEAGGPGVVGVDDGKRKYRVRLGSDEEYHRAVMAHDQESNVVVEGELSREGTLTWLYNAHLLGVVDQRHDSQPQLFEDREGG